MATLKTALYFLAVVLSFVCFLATVFLVGRGFPDSGGAGTLAVLFLLVIGPAGMVSFCDTIKKSLGGN